jgi:hypothetical protein
MGIEGLEPSRFNEPTDFHFIKNGLSLYSRLLIIRVAAVESLHLSKIRFDSGFCYNSPDFDSDHF